MSKTGKINLSILSFKPFTVANAPVLGATDQAFGFCTDGWGVLFSIGCFCYWSTNSWLRLDDDRLIGSSPALSGRYYFHEDQPVALTTLATPVNTLRAQLRLIDSPIRISQVSCNISTAVAASTVRYSLYWLNANLTPGSRVQWEAATTYVNFSGATVGQKNYTLAAPVTIQPGLYFEAFCSIGGAPTLSALAATSREPRLGRTSVGNTYITQLSAAYSTADLPSTFPTAGVTNISAGAYPAFGYLAA